METRMTTWAIAMLVSAFVLAAKADNFTVGEQRGWIVPNNGLNYTVWAKNITAHVGDSLYFRYNSNAHNVLKVNSTAYAACSSTPAGTLQTWDNGDTTVMLEQEGTHYFICGAPKHCVLGQAFALDVNPTPADVTPTGPSVLSPPGRSGAAFTSPAHYGITTLVTFVFLVARCPPRY